MVSLVPVGRGVGLRLSPRQPFVGSETFHVIVRTKNSMTRSGAGATHSIVLRSNAAFGGIMLRRNDTSHGSMLRSDAAFGAAYSEAALRSADMAREDTAGQWAHMGGRSCEIAHLVRATHIASSEWVAIRTTVTMMTMLIELIR